MKALNEFKEFLLRGNVVDLAVGVVIGTAFGNVVKSLVEDMLTPLVTMIGGNKDFSNLAFSINGSTFSYGRFLNSLISFAIIAFVVFFFVIKPMNSIMDRLKKGKEVGDTKICKYCLSDIPVDATKCKYCASELKK